MKQRPVCLAIGGSDSCGGAGIQADLSIFESIGVHGCSAITALTAQNPREITHIEPVSLAHLDMEMRAVFDYYDVAAIKTGMLVDAEHIAVVAACLGRRHCGKPLVIDPVMIASSGAELLDVGGREALSRALIPLATLITPNLEEAGFWLGRPVGDIREDALSLARRLDIAVLLKGGHAQGERLRDVFAMPDGSCMIFEHERKPWDDQQRHGTGCRLASAIAAYLAKGEKLAPAVRKGIASLQQAL